jgi:phage recombination protein Bet
VIATTDTEVKAAPVVSAPSVEEKSIRYVPIGGTEEIEISIGVMSNFIAHKTRSGIGPSRADLVRFMMLCKASALNPWTGDAYLIGYDTMENGVKVAKFSMIVAAQALFKRAELNKDFNGIESGVIVRNADGAIEYREGDFYLPEDDTEKLLGGWARVYRKNCDKPFYDALKLAVYSTGKSRWAVDPAGMIVKVAESSALRKAFPNTLADCYTREEMDHVIERAVEPREVLQSQPVDGTAIAHQARTLKDLARAKSEAKQVEPSQAEVKQAASAEVRVEQKTGEPKVEQAAVVPQVQAEAEVSGEYAAIKKKIDNLRRGDSDTADSIYHEILVSELSAKDQAELDKLIQAKM